jgi:arylsulfatase A
LEYRYHKSVAHLIDQTERLPLFILRQFLSAGLLGCCTLLGAAESLAPPNIVLILADDLGYGDLSCYGNKQVATPRIDSLARDGIRFTDAHTTSGVCTPSRYSLLTGRYCWRTFLKRRVISNGPALVEPGQTTLASVLQSAGYQTAILGKWHIGHTAAKEVDFNLQPVPRCANDVGFTYSFTLPVGHFYPPYVYLENGRIVGYHADDPLTIRGKEQIGGTSYSYERDRSVVTPELVRRSLEFIDGHRDKPFFLYLSTPNVHDPLTPSKAFTGHPAGPYGDYLMELDWAVGQVLDKLQASGLDRNTLVIFTSDNGGVDEHVSAYNPNAPLRGNKGDLYEGGHRLPFLIRWPGQAPAGLESHQFLLFTDVLKTCARLVNRPTGPKDGADGEDLLESFRGRQDLLSDRQVVIQGRAGMFGLRQGAWMYLHGPGNGDDAKLTYANPSERITNSQLYRLSDDLHQDRNLAQAEPERVEHMRQALERIVGSDAPRVNAGKARQKPTGGDAPVRDQQGREP